MKNKTTLNIIFYISIFALGSAYFIEYILDYKPCNLCLIERLPYFFAIIIILLGLSLKRFEKLIFISLGLIFASATILSLYHVGIEQGFFKESLACFSNNEILRGRCCNFAVNASSSKSLTIDNKIFCRRRPSSGLLLVTTTFN